MKHKFLILYSWFIRILLIWMPDIPFLMRFRGWCYGLGMPSKGSNFQVSHNVIINGLEGLSVGANVFINNGNILLVAYGLTIGDNVIIGPSCFFSTDIHLRQHGSYRFGGRIGDSICIGRNSWIGGHCSLLCGSILPPGSILAAGAVLTKKLDHIQNNSIYGGIPCRFIKNIENE